MPARFHVEASTSEVQAHATFGKAGKAGKADKVGGNSSQVLPSEGPVELFDPTTLTFPIRDDVRFGESGQGYALRMAGENSISGLPVLKRWLGKSRGCVLDAPDAPLIAQWFGAGLSSLQFALGRTATGKSEGGFEFGGEAIGRSYFVNRTYPRACPHCLRQYGHWRLDWDFASVTACEEHRIELQDTCMVCSRALDWNRPSLGSCTCGNSLAECLAQTSAGEIEVDFARWVRSRTMPEQRAFSGDEPLFALLGPLGLNSGFHLVHALAGARSYQDAQRASALKRKCSLGYSRAMLRNANDLTTSLLSGHSVAFRVSRPATVTKLLFDAVRSARSQAELSISQSILASVVHQGTRGRWSGSCPQMSQGLLF